MTNIIKSSFIFFITLFLAFNAFATDTEVNTTIVIGATQEQIWSALTSENELAIWWGKGVRLEPKINGEFYEPWGNDQLAVGTVVDIDKGNFIEFTWKEKYFNGNQITTCKFSITKSDGKTLLSVRHFGWESFEDEKQREELIAAFKGGWDFYLSKIKNYLEKK